MVTSSIERPATNDLPVMAWAILLAVSMLPDILYQEILGVRPAWLFWAKVGLVGCLLLASVTWKFLLPLRAFLVVVLTLYLIQWGVGWATRVLHMQTLLAKAHPFVREVGWVQIQNVAASILLMLCMLALFGSFQRFFLVKGKIDAQAEPIPFLLTRPPTWRILGPAIAGAMCLGLVAFIFVFGRPPSLPSLARVLPLLPFVLLFAATNAFGEEMLYRAPWLAALEGPLGSVQALLLTSVYFGVAHFYGVPYGVLGSLMAFIPGWLMGKAMLETRGFFWAWFIHICMDTVIFLFMALGSVNPGG